MSSAHVWSVGLPPFAVRSGRMMPARLSDGRPGLGMEHGRSLGRDPDVRVWVGIRVGAGARLWLRTRLEAHACTERLEVQSALEFGEEVLSLICRLRDNDKHPSLVERPIGRSVGAAKHPNQAVSRQRERDGRRRGGGPLHHLGKEVNRQAGRQRHGRRPVAVLVVGRFGRRVTELRAGVEPRLHQEDRR